MTQHQTSRTLVKSAPELWAECSDAASLARHLGAFGEIRIIKLEPETAVAWEGAAARGTVKLEPSGWGTRVTLTLTEDAARAGTEQAGAEPVDAQAANRAPEPVPPVETSVAVAEPSPVVEARVALEAVPVIESEPRHAGEPDPLAESPAAEPPVRPGLFGRLLLRLRGPRPEALEPETREAEAHESAAPAPEAAQPGSPEATRPGSPEAADPESPAPAAPSAVTAGTPAPAPAAPPQPAAEAVPPGEAVLTAALDSLGRAHHRPYSRA